MPRVRGCAALDKRGAPVEQTRLSRLNKHDFRAANTRARSVEESTIWLDYPNARSKRSSCSSWWRAALPVAGLADSVRLTWVSL